MDDYPVDVKSEYKSHRKDRGIIGDRMKKCILLRQKFC